MTDKQKLFVYEYIVDFNGARAYQEVYNCSYETAQANASRLLTKANIKALIDKKLLEKEKRTQITADRVINELAKVGFASLTNFVNISKDQEGNISIDLKENLGDCSPIQEINSNDGKIKLKLYNKVEALRVLGKFLGIEGNQQEEQALSKLDELLGDIDILANE